MVANVGGQAAQKHPHERGEDIKVEGEEVTEVVVREVTVKELRVIGKIANDMDANLKLAELLTGLPTSSMDQLTAKDYERVQKAVIDFLPDGRGIGGSF